MYLFHTCQHKSRTVTGPRCMNLHKIAKRIITSQFALSGAREEKVGEENVELAVDDDDDDCWQDGIGK